MKPKDIINDGQCEWLCFAYSLTSKHCRSEYCAQWRTYIIQEYVNSFLGNRRHLLLCLIEGASDGKNNRSASGCCGGRVFKWRCKRRTRTVVGERVKDRWKRNMLEFRRDCIWRNAIKSASCLKLVVTSILRPNKSFAFAFWRHKASKNFSCQKKRSSTSIHSARMKMMESLSTGVVTV